MAVAIAAVAAFTIPVAASPATADQQAEDAQVQIYEVFGTGTAQQRTQISRLGVDVLGSAGGTTTFIGEASDAAKVRSLGFRVEQRGVVDRSPEVSTNAINDFPPSDSGFHNYAEVTTVLRNAASTYSSIGRLSSVGNSYQGRALNMFKISDNVATDENEPEVLFTCGQHAREHLTTEMCLRIVNRFTQGYAADPAIKRFVDSTEIYVIPNVNPDGSEYDISGGSYKYWRKNRQGNGTDPNRNWAYNWGCCGGSSGSTTSETYRGPSAFSAPETRAVSNFVNSRKIGGVQQIKASIDFHTYSELVLWPFGFTYNDTAPGMTAAEAQRFQTVGRQLAATNGYTPQQSSDLYITDGTIDDWMWGTHKILSFTFEMYPRGSNPGFYPPDEVIVRETTRNDRAVDLLLNTAIG
ncbi:carboxypeptidase [Amycolatopsis sp. WAC 01376]|uniref:M14 family metallopeptidase n=1 Tax=Amycolatopsis sp. WAC 01376 TaxID=2203195 RepID=UPI000F77F2E6|nr:M14 family metallopeptidase [Amycolatopsis sp. WAC 01376]RSM66906.1 carboxypeptidase [Amycolatopsis sp. WAC 01376]